VNIDPELAIKPGMAVEHSSQISKLSLVTWEVDATTGEWLIIRIHLYI
jgi:hypothetical protein